MHVLNSPIERENAFNFAHLVNIVTFDHLHAVMITYSINVGLGLLEYFFSCHKDNFRFRVVDDIFPILL